jgi:hypothetical protein
LAAIQVVSANKDKQDFVFLSRQQVIPMAAVLCACESSRTCLNSLHHEYHSGLFAERILGDHRHGWRGTDAWQFRFDFGNRCGSRSTHVPRLG